MYVKPSKYVGDHNVCRYDSKQSPAPVCVHGFQFGHTATCPGHPDRCQHGFYSGHTTTCPGGQDPDAR